MITVFALFSLTRVPRDRSGAYLFIRDGLVGALVVFTAAGICGIF